jgi:hypothetical protein
MTKTDKTEIITISRPKFEAIALRLEGTAPYMQARFSKKAEMMKKMELGNLAKKGTKKEPRDFERDFREAQHLSEEGWIGIPATAFRNACIDACRMVGFQMTRARMSIFIEADGLDAEDGSPLVRIDGEPEMSTMTTRNATGVVDVRARPMWRRWSVDVVVNYDADQFNANDVVNLMARAGQQVGIGEGRPFSRQSNGLGFGTFRIAEMA